MKCNETQGKWCKNKHGASKIIDTFETYQNSIWEKRRTPSVFRSETLCRQKEGSRRWPRRPHHPLARPGLARATKWCGPLVALLCPVFWLREFSSKIGVLRYFLVFFLKVRFLHKNETPEQLYWKQRYSVLVVFKTHKLEKKIAKRFGEVDTFWTYQPTRWKYIKKE
jgi:hypothetical protein